MQALGRRDEADALFDYEALIGRRHFSEVEGWDSIDDFNAALVDHISARPDLMSDRPGVATKGGSQTGNILFDDSKFARSVRSMVETLYRDYIAAMTGSGWRGYFAAPPARHQLKANAVVLRSSGYQDPHIHPTGFCSGVYYVQIPKVVGDGNAGTAGHILFGRSAGKQDNGRRLTIKPEAGLMVIFPSYLWHATVPFESDEDRISVAIDVIAATG